MNNLLFGDATFGYYETICGGAGATAEADGADAVHTHMTNTRLTDPEVLERRYPVRLREFSIRRGSGGAGRHRGGDGVVRRIEFLADVGSLDPLAAPRSLSAPYGLAGGQPGALGRNMLQPRRRLDGDSPRRRPFHRPSRRRLTLHTPGGGGFGEARQDFSAMYFVPCSETPSDPVFVIGGLGTSHHSTTQRGVFEIHWQVTGTPADDKMY